MRVFFSSFTLFYVNLYERSLFLKYFKKQLIEKLKKFLLFLKTYFFWESLNIFIYIYIYEYINLYIYISHYILNWKNLQGKTFMVMFFFIMNFTYEKKMFLHQNIISINTCLNVQYLEQQRHKWYKWYFAHNRARMLE